MKIIFVGDKPSPKNIDPNIPFVGTQSYKTLLDWIWRMDLNISNIILCNKDKLDDIVLNMDTYDYYSVKIVSLGREAEKISEVYTDKHFNLPHPSGRNRKLNDKKYVSKILKECKEWIKC
jgi:hypothetical protein